MARKCYILSLSQKIVFFNEIFASCAILTLQTKPIGVLCSAFPMPSYILLCACAVSRKLFCPFPLHVMQVSFVGFVSCVRIVFGHRLSRAASIDLEDCLDLAIRKGKAVGETKPTENIRAIISSPYIVHFARMFASGICHAVFSSVLFHRAIFCISRIFLCAPQILGSCADY